MAILTKIEAHRYGENHPNGINIGYKRESKIYDPEPIIGESYFIGSFGSSPVTEIISKDDKGFVFKTKNSTYKVEL